ncbi:MAG: PorV/PorQ family protein [Candidatus Krumholzibacteria bacterium]|nr:PorV/PorQ family protein [Candidatus Krumholzibacteria bacterium]
MLLTSKAQKARRAWLTVALMVLAWAPAPAQGQDGDGGTQSVFSIGAGSRAISLGGAYVSLVDDASSIFWNPAALRNVQDKQLMGMYMPLYNGFADATYTFLGAVYPTLSAGSWGIGFLRVSTDFEGFDAASVPTGTQEYSETQILFGYAFQREYDFLLGSLGTGLNFKIGNQTLAGLSSTSPGIDLGFTYHPQFAEAFTLGVNFQDVVGPSYKLNRESDDIPRTILTGLGYTRVLRNGSALRAMVQLNLPEQADASLRAGAEYAFSRLVSLRLGVDDARFTFGLGVNVKGFGLDYAFLNRETAGNSQPVTFTARYGRTLYEQREIMAKEQARRDQEMIQQAFSDRIQEHKDLAARNEAEGNLPGALDEWKIVAEYLPGDTEAADKIATLSQALIEEQARATRDIEKRTTISTHFSQGLRFYQENDYVRARDQWRVIIGIDSTHAEATAYLERTQEKIDDQLRTHVRAARQLEGQRRLTQAIGEWNNVQLLDPGNSEANTAINRIRSKIENQSQDLEQAATQLRIVSLYNTALQDFNQDKYEAAQRGIEELLRLEPRHEEAKTLLAMTNRKMTPLTKEEEASIRRLYLRGMQHFSKDQYKEAIAEWEKILDIDPTNESVKRNIEEAQERLKQLGR